MLVILNLNALGLVQSNTLTQEDAESAIEEVKGALSTVNGERAEFGAWQNRLEHAYDINKNSAENTQYAESQIRDTDMAREMVEYSNQGILEQAGDYSGAAEPPFRKNEYRKSGIAYRLNFCCCASLLA